MSEPQPLGIHARRLLIADALRKTPLWRTFHLQRDFEAFSIHMLARECEAIFNAHGVVSSFAVTRWQKAGNGTIVEGVLSMVAADTGDRFDVPSVGEGVDDGDKGIGKALSSARKNAMIAALNLGIGRDIEDEHQAAVPALETPMMQGEPAQEAPIAGLATIVVAGRAQAVLFDDMIMRVTGAIQNLANIPAIEDFEAANKDAFRAFWAANNQKGFALKRIIAARKEQLQETIDKTRAAA